jgi:hypothetical protein
MAASHTLERLGQISPIAGFTRRWWATQDISALITFVETVAASIHPTSSHALTPRTRNGLPLNAQNVAVGTSETRSTPALKTARPAAVSVTTKIAGLREMQITRELISSSDHRIRIRSSRRPRPVIRRHPR